MSYPYILGPTVWDANVHAVRLRWPEAGKEKLESESSITRVPLIMLKAVSEHFCYLLAHRLGNQQVLIK